MLGGKMNPLFREPKVGMVEIKKTTWNSDLVWKALMDAIGCCWEGEKKVCLLVHCTFLLSFDWLI